MQVPNPNPNPNPYKPILNWSLAYIDMRINLYKKLKLKNGLLMLYPVKRYSIPAPLRFIAHPSMVECDKDNIYCRVTKKHAVIKIDEYENVQLTKYNIHANVVQIYLLPPKVLKIPRYYLLVTSFQGRQTGMGGLTKVEVIRTNAIKYWRLSNSSNSGNHWIDYYVFLLPFKEPEVILKEINISNRGNEHEELIDLISSKSVSRYEIQYLQYLNRWSSLVKVTDNLTGETFLGLELIYHESRKTPAKTEHVIEPRENIEVVKTNYHPEKTHYSELVKIKGPITLKTIRVSNKGNTHESTYKISPDGVLV